MLVARALILDMDGLMVDSEPLWFEVEREFARRRSGGKAEWTRELWRACIGRGLATTVETMHDKFGFEVDVERDKREIVDLFVARVAELALKPGCAELLDASRAARVPLAVASSSGRRLILAVLRRFDIEGRFAVVVSGDDVASPKPAPDIFLKAARDLNVEPRGCVVIEDSPAGVKAAQAARMAVIAVPDTSSHGDKAPEGDVVARDLHAALANLKLEP
jgi:HAD superfamily hydrolase (TIGR01509 family)